MATKIAISIGHLQEIRQQKSSVLAFSAKAGHKLEEPINNLFHTIQTTCGQANAVLPGEPSLYDWAKQGLLSVPYLGEHKKAAPLLPLRSQT